jgi:hypothetical protein
MNVPTPEGLVGGSTRAQRVLIRAGNGGLQRWGQCLPGACAVAWARRAPQGMHSAVRRCSRAAGGGRARARMQLPHSPICGPPN